MEKLDLRENTDGALNAVQAKINEVVDWINSQQSVDAVSKIMIESMPNLLVLSKEELLEKLCKPQS